MIYAILSLVITAKDAVIKKFKKGREIAMKRLKFKGSEFRVSSFSNIDPVPFCVAVAKAPDGSVAVRHSQDSDPAKQLVFTKEEWDAFIKGVKANEFDV